MRKAYLTLKEKLWANHRDRPTCAIFIPAWVPIGGIRFFPAIKIIMIHQVCIYCGLSMKINTHETPHVAQRSWAHLVCISFCMCGQQKPKYPNWSSMANAAICTGRYRSSGISFLYPEM